jgi:NDP-sugar pyrophosphorylase family protein
MKAMIFAAGLGTRLKPLTDSLPKALIPIGGKPLLEHVISKLKAFGFDQIINFLKANNNFGICIEVSNEGDELLDTGGGIRKAAWFFDDGNPFLVHNVDILSNVDLSLLYNQHLQSDSLATLVVSHRDTFRYLLFDENLCLNGWINEKTGETKPAEFKKSENNIKLAFAGIQVLSPNVFELMNDLNPKFSIMDFYLSNVQSQQIVGFVPTDFKMLDVGKLNVLDEAEKFVTEQSSELH